MPHTTPKPSRASRFAVLRSAISVAAISLVAGQTARADSFQVLPSFSASDGSNPAAGVTLKGGWKWHEKSHVLR